MKNAPLKPLFDSPARKALSAKEAVALHDIFADNPALGFRDFLDGCHARAHEMCRELERMGIKPFKAMAFRDPDAEEGYLSPRILGTSAEKRITGDFHIAPAVPVEIAPGTVKTMILDPLLFDGPVEQADWAKAFGARFYMVQVLPFGEKPKRYGGDYHPLMGISTDAETDVRARKTLEKLAAQNIPPLQRVVLPSPLRAQMVREGANLPAFGTTWISKDLIAPPESTQDIRPPSMREHVSGFFRKVFVPEM